MLQPGVDFAGYRIEQRLSGDRTGDVYLAAHPQSAARVALKVFGSDVALSYRRRFVPAVQRWTQVEHPGIARVLGGGEADGRLWLAREFTAGTDLAEMLRQNPAGLRVDLATHVVGWLAAALDHLHGCGLLSGAIKPADVTIDAQHRVLVTGFDIAQSVGDVHATACGEPTLADVEYAAPEQLREARLDGRSDQYSLACLAFQLLTGRPPYRAGSAVAVVAAHLTDPVPAVRELRPDLTAGLDGVLARAMAKDPRQRFTSCAEFAADLAAVTAAADTVAPGAPSASAAGPAADAPGWGGADAAPTAQTGRRRWPWLVGAVAAVAVIAVVAAVVLSKTVLGSGLGTVTAWDDTLYPDELTGMHLWISDSDGLSWVDPRAEARWTAESVRGAVPIVADGDTVFVGQSSQLIGLDIDSGAVRFPAVDLHVQPSSCAVRANRIACVAGPGSGEHDSTVVFLDRDSGTILRTLKVQNRKLEVIRVAGDRFVVLTQPEPFFEDKGYAVGYDTEGEQVWDREAAGTALYMVGSRVLVDFDRNHGRVVFLGASDSREILRTKRPRGSNDDVVWDVFRTGIAVQNADWTGADFYNLTGEKTGTIRGWQPAGGQVWVGNVDPLPLLTRIDRPYGYQHETHTIAAANPDTGHLVWRISDPGMNARQSNTIDRQLIVSVEGAGVEAEYGKFRVYDVRTGESKSPVIDFGGQTAEYYRIQSDGRSLIYDHVDNVRAYRIDGTGVQWELPEIFACFVGQRMYGTKGGLTAY